MHVRHTLTALLCGAMVCASVMGLAGCGSAQSDEMKEYVAAAREAEAAGDYRSAADALENAIDAAGPFIGQEEVNLLYELALDQKEASRSKDALMSYSKLIKLMPDCAPFYYERGETYVLAGSYTAAEQDFEQVLLLDPLNYEQAAEMYRKLSERSAGEQANTLLSCVTDEQATDLMTEALIAMNEAEYEKAQKKLAAAEETLGDTMDILLYRAYCCEELADYEGAEQLYVNYMANYHEDTRVLNQRAVCLVKQAKYEEALFLINQALKMKVDDNRQTLAWNKIMITERLSQFSEARTLLNTYMAAYPGDAEAEYEWEYLQGKETIKE